MLGQVNARPTDLESGSDFFDRPSLEGAQIENLELLFVHPGLCFGNGGVDHGAAPFLIPLRIKRKIGFIGKFEEEGKIAVKIGHANRTGFAFPEMIEDTPLRELSKPGFERANPGIVIEFRHAADNADDGFLDDILSLGVVQPSTGGRRIDEAPIGLEELLPAILIFKALEALQERLSGWN